MKRVFALALFAAVAITSSMAQGIPTPAQPTQPLAATPGKHQPAAKTPEEYKAYQEAVAKPDAPSTETAADTFAVKFPESELRAPLYQRAMILYRNANNTDKALEMGRKTIQFEPDNGPALVTVADILSTHTREIDLDRDERLAEAKKDATKAVELAKSGEAVPAGTPADQVQTYKNTIMSMAYSALGSVDFDDKNYPSAERNFRLSIQAEPDSVTLYQLALTLQRQGKNPDALAAAQKCVQLSAENPQVAKACGDLQTYLQKVVNNPPPSTPAAGTPSTTPQPK